MLANVHLHFHILHFYFYLPQNTNIDDTQKQMKVARKHNKETMGLINTGLPQNKK